jgi:hypothetical protein
LGLQGWIGVEQGKAPCAAVAVSVLQQQDLGVLSSCVIGACAACCNAAALAAYYLLLYVCQNLTQTSAPGLIKQVRKTESCPWSSHPAPADNSAPLQHRLAQEQSAELAILRPNPEFALNPGHNSLLHGATADQPAEHESGSAPRKRRSSCARPPPSKRLGQRRWTLGQ